MRAYEPQRRLTAADKAKLNRRAKQYMQAAKGEPTPPPDLGVEGNFVWGLGRALLDSQHLEGLKKRALPLSPFPEERDKE